jgi:outer membrane lipoprotein-sorting protein
MKHILLCLITLFAFNAFADNVDPKLMDKFKGYVKDIQKVAVDFVQIDSKNIKFEGTLLINKPYKFRCNYFPPHPILIVGNRNYVSIYDYEMEHTSRINTYENIFNFLLTDDIEFDRHFEVEAASDSDQELKVRLLNLDLDKSSIVTFDKIKNQIKKLEIIEDNEIITVSFANVKKVKSFDDDLFIFKSTEVYGPPARLNKVDLEKKYNTE